VKEVLTVGSTDPAATSGKHLKPDPAQVSRTTSRSDTRAKKGKEKATVCANRDNASRKLPEKRQSMRVESSPKHVTNNTRKRKAAKTDKSLAPLYNVYDGENLHDDCEERTSKMPNITSMPKPKRGRPRKDNSQTVTIIVVKEKAGDDEKIHKGSQNKREGEDMNRCERDIIVSRKSPTVVDSDDMLVEAMSKTDQKTQATRIMVCVFVLSVHLKFRKNCLLSCVLFVIL
jgi:hypothetical protein